MDNHVFSSLLRSFSQCGPIQLERAQDHLHHHLQPEQRHQTLAARVRQLQSDLVTIPSISFIGVDLVTNSATAVRLVEKRPINWMTLQGTIAARPCAQHRSKEGNTLMLMSSSQR